ncbi:MAG: TrmH family RNA methyltransferase [Dehalobacterium sp.]|jgi:TrmH family RNA methyltransferase
MKENIKKISSKSNHHIKLAKSLLHRKSREKEQLFVVEGVRLVEEAVLADNNIKFVLYSDKLLASQRGQHLINAFNQTDVDVFWVEENLLRELSDTENPQGIFAVGEMFRHDLQALNIKKNSLLLLIDGVQDPGNLGTMIRTACAVGAAGVILTKGTVDLYNPKVIRASMGTIFQIPVISEESNEKCLKYFQKHQVRILVADAKGDKLYYQTDIQGPVVWVLGNEANGPRAFFLNHAHEIARIPLLGMAESLNVAVAAGILLFDHIRRQEEQTILVN